MAESCLLCVLLFSGWQPCRSSKCSPHPTMAPCPQARPHPTCPYEGLNYVHLRAGFTLIFYWIVHEQPGHSKVPSSSSALHPILASALGGPGGHCQPRAIFSQGLATTGPPIPGLGCCFEINPVSPLPFSLGPEAHFCMGHSWALVGNGLQPSPLAVPTLRRHQTRHSTVQRSSAGSTLQLGVEGEEVGCCIGCGRWHMPGR